MGGIVSNVAQAVGPALTFFSMLYLGNNWSMAALQSVLMFGMVVLNPICCILMLFFEKAPFETTEVGAEEEEDDVAADSMRALPGAAWVPWLAAGSDLITCIGAG